MFESTFYLYKYFSLSGNISKGLSRVDNLIKILIDEAIFVPKLADLNDPYELLINNDCTKTGVLSFSTNYDNLIMWAHYADSYKGCVLKFKVKNNKHIKKVQYIENQSELSHLAEKELIKSVNWSYENEYRFVTDRGGDYVLLDDIGLKIDGVIFGPRVEQFVEEQILTPLKAKEFCYGRSRLRNDFKLELISYKNDYMRKFEQFDIYGDIGEYDHEDSLSPYFEDDDRDYEKEIENKLKKFESSEVYKEFLEEKNICLKKIRK